MKSSFSQIDAPAAIISSRKARDAWIEKLRAMPQDDPGVQNALRWALAYRKSQESSKGAAR